MVLLQSVITLMLATSGLPLGASARECYTNETKTDGDRVFTATSPDQLHVFDGCTKLDGIIRIDPSFPGSFVLPNVTEITGIATYGNDSTLEAIELPDLKEVVALGVYNDKGLKRLLLPRLEAIGMGTLALPADAVVDLGALKYVYWFMIGAPWANLSLPALEQADNIMIGDNAFDPEQVSPRDPVPVDIHLPALREVDGLDISALVRSLAVPKLEVIGGEGMKVAAGYADLPAIDLPSLHRLHGPVAFSGHIKRINLGPIKETSYEISINSETPVEIDSALTKIIKLNITGVVKALNFEALPYVKTLTIEPSTQGQAHCSPSIIELYRFRYRPQEADFCDSESLRLAGPNAWADYSSPIPSSSSESTPSLAPPDYDPSYTPTPTPTLTPTPPPTPSPGASGPPGLGSAAEVVILASFGLIAILSIIWFWKHDRKTKFNDDDDAEEDPVGKRVIALSVADKERLDSEENDPLLRCGDLADYEEDVDAPPPYTKHSSELSSTYLPAPAIYQIHCFHDSPVDWTANVEELHINSEGDVLGPETGLTWLRATPAQFRKLLVWIWTRYEIPIFITENGCPCPGESEMSVEQAADDEFRVRYFATYLDAMSRAIYQDGVKVLGYYAWSFMDNFEWFAGYGPRFGITHVDYKTLKRTPKKSATYLRETFRGRRAAAQDS
ncbi:hypothetical protein BJX62DRAFT_239878 [Aspergillus germanicus]